MSVRIPPYCRQRESDRPDRAFVRIDGKKVFLGRHGSPQSKARYAEAISGVSELGTTESTQSTDPTVSELIADYLEYARRYYLTPDGNNGREFELSRDVCRFARRSTMP
jgi:hypothetical protein